MGVVYYFLCSQTILMVAMHGIAVWLRKWWTLNSVATMREVHSTVSLPQGSGIFFMSTVEKTCSCFGHSDVAITDELTTRTRIEIDRAIEEGVRIFLFGGRSDFDDLCYDLVTEKRNADPQLNIKRVFCFALDKQLRKPPRWFIPKEYEALECPTKDFDYWYTAIYYRSNDKYVSLFICKMSHCRWLIFVKQIGKFWEVADFKDFVTNG